MNLALAAIAAAELALLVWGVAQRRGVARFTKRRVVIHTIKGSSIQGVLRETYLDCFVLGSPKYLDEAQPADLPGEVTVLRTQVDFVQVL